MAKNPPDKRLVYLALKEIFKGGDAHIRRARKISELVQKHQHENCIQNLIKRHNTDAICNVAKILLKEQIFESELKAKICFPEVFKVSSSQGAARAIFESEAAKTKADAIQCAAKGRQTATALNDCGHEVSGVPKGKEIGMQI